MPLGEFCTVFFATVVRSWTLVVHNMPWVQSVQCRKEKESFAAVHGFLLIIRGFVKVSVCNAEHERCKKSLPKRKLRLKTLTSSP